MNLPRGCARARRWLADWLADLHWNLAQWHQRRALHLRQLARLAAMRVRGSEIERGRL